MGPLEDRERQLLERLAAEGKATKLYVEDLLVAKELVRAGLLFLVGAVEPYAIITPKGRRLLAILEAKAAEASQAANRLPTAREARLGSLLKQPLGALFEGALHGSREPLQDPRQNDLEAYVILADINSAGSKLAHSMGPECHAVVCPSLLIERQKRKGGRHARKPGFQAPQCFCFAERVRDRDNERI